MKLLVVGWDAATRKHLKDVDIHFWDSLGHYGNLVPEELFNNTYIDSGNAWTTITTGTSYKNHRIFGLVHGPYTGHPYEEPLERIVNQNWLPQMARRVMLGLVLGSLATEGQGRGGNPQSTDVPYKRVWEYLPGNALVFGLPITYPAWSTNGVLVSGIPAPRPEQATQPLVSPPHLQETIFDTFSGYHVEMTSPIHDKNSSEEEYCRLHEQKTEEVTDRYLDTYREYDQEYDFEFGFLMLRSIDDVLHATTNFELIRRVYNVVDRCTQRVIEEIDPNAVLVLSDHGMSPTSRLRVDKDIKMDHDTTQGVWGGSVPFDMQSHLDVTPAILDYYGVDASIPEEREEYGVTKQRVDQTAVQDQLRDLGYL